MRLIKRLKENIWLILICLLFLTTRLVKIAEIPGSVYWDEASIGYNAYSITVDLKDEWGEFLPFHFRAFGEFKLPVYIYTVAVFVKLFGLNAFSVRIPAVLFSLGIIVITYFLVLKLFKKRSTALFSAFFLTTMPWFYIFSRTGYEAMAGLFFFLLAIYVFLFVERKWAILLSTLFFIAAIYSYNAFRILTPLILIVLVILKIELLKLRKNWLWLLASALVLAGAVIPIARLYLLDYGSVRLSTVGIKNAGEFIRNYFSHFSLDFLFVNGDENPRSQFTGEGQIYWLNLVLIILGIIYLIKKKLKQSWIILFLLLISPIPASITRESPHALRSIVAVFPWAVISALGIEYLVMRFKKQRTALIVGSVVLTLAFFGRYLEIYFKNYNRLFSSSWQSGMRQIFDKYKDQFDKYEEVVIDDHFGQPYIFALYYLKKSPSEFREEGFRNTPDKWGHSSTSSFGNFVFKTPDESDFVKNRLIFSAEEFKSFETKGEVKQLDGSVTYWVYSL